MEFLHDNMVTKDDLKTELTKQKLEILDKMEEKFVDMTGDLVVLMRKGDQKMVGLVTLLRDKRVITEDEAKTILQMEPFPQLFI